MKKKWTIILTTTHSYDQPIGIKDMEYSLRAQLDDSHHLRDWEIEHLTIHHAFTLHEQGN